MNKLKVINDNNQIDLVSLSNFLLRKKDDYLEALLKINGYKKLIIDYTSDFFFDRILPYGESKYFNVNIIPDQYWYNYDFCMRVISSNGCGYLLSYVPVELRDYKLCKKAVSDKNSAGIILGFVPKKLRDYSLCEIAVYNDWMNLEYVPENLIDSSLCEIAITQNGYSLKFVPKELRDYSLCEKAVNNNAFALQFVPKNIENYYSLLKIGFKQYDSALVSNEWFPINYIPQLIKDFPQYKESLESYLLQEYIIKEVKKLLREYYLKEK
jgi:hypothetical protein